MSRVRRVEGERRVVGLLTVWVIEDEFEERMI